MNLPVIIAIISCLFFGAAAIAISIQNDKLRKRNAKLERKSKQKVFEAAILSEVNNSLYSFDPVNLPDMIAAKNNSLLDFTVIAVLSIKNSEAVFKARLNGSAGAKYIDHVKEKLISSMQALGQMIPQDIKTDAFSGDSPVPGNNSVPAIYFNFPVIINSEITAVLNISATNKDSLKTDDIASVYKTVEQICKTASAGKKAFDGEKHRIKTALDGLEDGIVVMENKSVKLINSKAMSLLDIYHGEPTASDILSGLPGSYNFEEKITKVISERNKYEENNVVIKNHAYNITINPLPDTAGKSDPKTTGVSILIHDSEPNSKASQMKEDFTNIIVHELRSPLTSIKASCEMLNGQAVLTDDERKQLIKIINTQSTKMLDEVTMILDAAKIDSGLFTVQKNPGDIRQVINDTIGDISSGAESKFVKVVAEIAPNLPQFAFDSYHIKKALANLILNSIKFTAGGGSVVIRAWQDSGKIRISIIDNGVGIPKEKQHLLFTKFSQLQDPSAKVGKGLGLYVTKGIIEAHGGSIVLDSETGKGTTVTISIPFTPIISPQLSFERTQTQINPMAN